MRKLLLRSLDGHFYNNVDSFSTDEYVEEWGTEEDNRQVKQHYNRMWLVGNRLHRPIYHGVWTRYPKQMRQRFRYWKRLV